MEKQDSDYGIETTHPPPHSEKKAMEGYCLVFARETDQYRVYIEGNRLRAEEKPDFAQKQEQSFKYKYLKQKSSCELSAKERENLLHSLVKRSDTESKPNIQYTIAPSKYDRNLICVVVSVDRAEAEKYAGEHEVLLEVNPQKAIKQGRKLRNFKLAHNTLLPSEQNHVCELCRTYNNPEKSANQYLNVDHWKYMHLPFEDALDRCIYKIPEHGTSVLDNRLFLRILYDIITDDSRTGSYSGRLSDQMENPLHPLQYMFAINDPDMRSHVKIDNNIFGLCREQHMEHVQQIRDYYGELIAFYFAFLMHYQKFLLYLAPLGALWFIIQLSLNKIIISGSIVIILAGLIWSTVMLEQWYRTEHSLQFRWGMTRYERNETPRPGFLGVMRISPGDGALEYTHASKLQHYFKITSAMGTVAFCITCVVVVVSQIWQLQKHQQNSTTGRLWVGIVNALQIQIFNYLYVNISLWLNNFENHRLEQEYYNFLVIKRILFYIINSFNSVVYLAFYINWDSNEDCMKAVRMQLVVIFLMAIFIQNCMEVLFPKMWNYVFEWRAKQANKDKYEPISESTDKSENKGVVVDISSVKKEENTYREMEEEMRRADMPNFGQELSVEDSVWEDIWSQIKKSPSPSVLDNTAEIVVLHGYVVLFIVAFPLMPVLLIVNNLFEFRVDFYNLLDARRPVPFSSNGIGVWKPVLSGFNIVAIFSNIALLTWRTDTVSNMLGHEPHWKWGFFFFTSLCLMIIHFVITYATPDMSGDTSDALKRQEACEKFLFNAGLAHKARKAIKEGIVSRRQTSVVNIGS